MRSHMEVGTVGGSPSPQFSCFQDFEILKSHLGEWKKGFGVPRYFYNQTHPLVPSLRSPSSED